MAPWHVLGFTADDVVVRWQDARLAAACVEALNAAGRPAGFQILRGGAQGDYLITWYVNEVAARVLDAFGVAWRAFLVGEATSSPAGARSALADVAPSAHVH